VNYYDENCFSAVLNTEFVVEDTYYDRLCV